MKRAYKIILLISGILVFLLVVVDLISDKPNPPYTLSHTIYDVLFFGSLMTALLFVILSGTYYVIDQLVRLIRRYVIRR